MKVLSEGKIIWLQNSPATLKWNQSGYVLQELYNGIIFLSRELRLDLGGDVGSILDNSAARHKLSIRPKKKYVHSRQKKIEYDSISAIQR